MLKAAKAAPVSAGTGLPTWSKTASMLASSAIGSSPEWNSCARSCSTCQQGNTVVWPGQAGVDCPSVLCLSDDGRQDPLPKTARLLEDATLESHTTHVLAEMQQRISGSVAGRLCFLAV